MEELQNVLWIGGMAGAGKTTIARRLARRYGLRRYNPDTQTWNHLAQRLAEEDPAAQRFSRMTPAERATAKSATIDYNREPLIVQDLRSLPEAPLVLAELVPPHSVIASVGQAVSLMPSYEAQRIRLERRHPQGVPEQYLRTWQATSQDLQEAGCHVIVVDDQTIDDTLAAVEQFFAPKIAEGPTADTTEERRDLLRYANRAILDQCLGWSRYTPGAGDVSGAPLEFDCECADLSCAAVIKRPVAEASMAMVGPPPSLLADGHPV